VEAINAFNDVSYSDDLWVYIPSDVCPLPAAICRSPSSLTQTVTQGQNATSQSFSVWNCGGGMLNYVISVNATWLSVFPAGGSSTFETDAISVDYSAARLSPGTYPATITISSPGLTPQTISVALTVNPGAPVLTTSSPLPAGAV